MVRPPDAGIVCTVHRSFRERDKVIGVKAIMIGSGIAGLAAALALKRCDISCAVYERGPEIREVGAGLALWANGVNALGSLGVKQAVVAVSAAPEHSITLSENGTQLNRTSLDGLSRNTARNASACGAASYNA
jgi:2-polyprenyl-6-methoxyphenol hydroxylase-like FAD-dependent oxidoreductase